MKKYGISGMRGYKLSKYYEASCFILANLDCNSTIQDIDLVMKRTPTRLKKFVKQIIVKSCRLVLTKDAKRYVYSFVRLSLLDSITNELKPKDLSRAYAKLHNTYKSLYRINIMQDDSDCEEVFDDVGMNFLAYERGCLKEFKNFAENLTIETLQKIGKVLNERDNEAWIEEYLQ